MNNENANTYSMYLILQKVCDRYRSRWLPHAAFNNLYTRWSAQVAAIGFLSPQQGQTTKGLTKQKRRLRQLVCADALEVARATRTCALQSGDDDLAHRMNYSFDSLLRGRDTASAERCQTIHTEATARLAALADYGIDAPKLLALQQSIHAYTAALPTPRGTIAEKKRATQQLKQTFATAQKLLRDGLDNLLPQFARTAPDFAADYKNARKIIHLPATHKTKADSESAEKNETESPEKSEQAEQTKPAKPSLSP